MLKINLICVGESKNPYLDKEIERYRKFLKGFCKLEIKYPKSFKASKTFSESRCVSSEGELIMKQLSGTNVLLDEKGKEMSSREFADFLRKFKDRGESLTFVIGGAYGLSEEVKENADHCLSFSKMTFTHQMIRVFLLEQLYRGFCIIQGKEYHND